MTKQSAFFLSIALVTSVAFGCGGSSTVSSTSSGTSGGSAATTGGSNEPVTSPKIQPSSETANNDFKAIALADPGATICFRTDGKKPTCDMATAACTGGAQTYNGTTQIPIDGTLTTAATGSVTLLTIACQPGELPSNGSSASYVLQVAAPTMSDPNGPGTLAFEGAKPLDPQISTATVSSSSNVQLWYTVGAPPSIAAPTCSSGAGPLPATGTGSSGPISDATGGLHSFLTSTTFQVIGCKTGYLPSAVVTIAYNVQLDAPSVLAVNASEDGGAWPAAVKAFDYDVTFEVDDHLNAGASDTLCVVVGSSMPACDPSGDCDAGMSITPAGAIVGSFQIGNAMVYSELISAIACGPSGLSSSPVSSNGPYQLLLPPVISQPATGLAIPSDGSGLQITLKEAAANPDDPSSAQPAAYDYICWTEDGSVPSCSMDCPPNGNGTVIDNVIQGQQHGGVTVQPPTSGQGALNKATFPAGVTLVAVGCINSSPAPVVVFGPAPLSDIVISAPQ